MKTIKIFIAITILSFGYALGTQAAPPASKLVRMHRLHELHHHHIHHQHRCHHHVVIVK